MFQKCHNFHRKLIAIANQLLYPEVWAQKLANKFIKISFPLLQKYLHQGISKFPKVAEEESKMSYLQYGSHIGNYSNTLMIRDNSGKEDTSSKTLKAQ